MAIGYGNMACRKPNIRQLRNFPVAKTFVLSSPTMEFFGTTFMIGTVHLTCTPVSNLHCQYQLTQNTGEYNLWMRSVVNVIPRIGVSEWRVLQNSHDCMKFCLVHNYSVFLLLHANCGTSETNWGSIQLQPKGSWGAKFRAIRFHNRRLQLQLPESLPALARYYEFTIHVLHSVNSVEFNNKTA